MVRVNIAQTPDAKIPVIIPDGQGSETIYADARFAGDHIVLTPAEGYATESFKTIANHGLVVGMTLDTPEHICREHPFLDGNGLDKDDTENLLVNPSYEVFDGISGVDWSGEETPEKDATGMAEEPDDAKIWRLEGEEARVRTLRLIMDYRNSVPNEVKLRQIAVVLGID